MNRGNKQTRIYLVALLLFILLAIIGCKLGGINVTFKEVFDVFADKLGLSKLNSEASQMDMIIWNLRVPRIILAFVVGGGLAICGVAMQALTQNVLAEPYILGVASGASFTVVLANLLFFSNTVLLNTLIPGFAFVGAIIATYLVYQIGGVGSNNKLILAGMAISIIFNALSSLLIHFLPSNSSLKNITMWMWGSLAGARWDNIMIPTIVSILGVIIFTCLGTNFIRGADHKMLFKVAFLGGGIFLVSMDILARTILAPREIAVGVFSALCGGPFFIWLLYKNTKGLER